MAKKQTAPVKKQTVPVKKQASAKKTETSAAQARAFGVEHEHLIKELAPEFMKGLEAELKTLRAEFQLAADNNLTPQQRSRKTGAGTRNYRFINDVSDVAAANPHYGYFFNVQNLQNSVRNVRMCQEIIVLLQTFSRAVSNTLLVYSTDAYDMALNYYGTVKAMRNLGDPNAMEIFHALQRYFKRPKRSSAGPTVKQTEKDVHAVLTHKKEGKVVVQGVSPKTAAGALKVFDDVHKGRSAAKESGEIDREE